MSQAHYKRAVPQACPTRVSAATSLALAKTDATAPTQTSPGASSSVAGTAARLPAATLAEIPSQVADGITGTSPVSMCVSGLGKVRAATSRQAPRATLGLTPAGSVCQIPAGLRVQTPNGLLAPSSTGGSVASPAHPQTQAPVDPPTQTLARVPAGTLDCKTAEQPHRAPSVTPKPGLFQAHIPSRSADRPSVENRADSISAVPFQQLDIPSSSFFGTVTKVGWLVSA